MMGTVLPEAQNGWERSTPQTKWSTPQTGRYWEQLFLQKLSSFDSWMTPRQRAKRCSTASRVANASLLCFQDPFGLLCNVRRGAVSSWRESRGTGQYFVVAWLMSWAYSTLGLCWVSKTAHMFSSPIPPKQKHWRPKSNKYCCFTGAWWLEVSTNAEWPLYIYLWNDLSAIARGALCCPFCFLILFGICTWVSHDSISKAKN